MGTSLDDVIARPYPPVDRFTNLQNLIAKIQLSLKTSAKNCLYLLGYIAKCILVTQHARFHLQCFQGWLKTVYIPNKHSLNEQVSIPHQVLDLLSWRKNPSIVSAGVPFF